MSVYVSFRGVLCLNCTLKTNLCNFDRIRPQIATNSKSKTKNHIFETIHPTTSGYLKEFQCYHELVLTLHFNFFVDVYCRSYIGFDFSTPLLMLSSLFAAGWRLPFLFSSSAGWGATVAAVARRWCYTVHKCDAFPFHFVPEIALSNAHRIQI